MGGCIPPLFWVGGGGMACKNIPPTLFEDKITLNFDIYCIEIDLFNCITIKNSKNRSLAHKCILRLDLCGFASTYMYSFLDIIYVKKGIE